MTLPFIPAKRVEGGGGGGDNIATIHDVNFAQNSYT
jgi:hypothetical protein